MENMFTKWRDEMILKLSDCDGMCNHCDPKLKKLCDKEKLSDCCGAKIICTDLCSECKEHV